MSRTLLVDTNRAAYPIYRALGDLGHEVSVVGSNAAEPLAKLSPNYIPLDYSDEEALAGLVAERRFVYLVPGCTDVSHTSCAAINGGRFPGLDLPEATYRINDKAEFRRTAEGLGLTVPRVLTDTEALARQSVIVKPVDAFSGRGMQVLHQPSAAKIEAALAVARAASKTGRALIEEYVHGQLHSHSAFVRAGKIVTDVFVREDCIASPYAVDVSCVTEELDVEIRNALRAQIERLAVGLDLVDGLLHTQVIVGDQQFWIIEATRRCPGDLYASLIELSTGYPYAGSYAAPFIGRHSQPAGALNRRESIVRHTVTATDGANLWGLQFDCEVAIRLWIPLATAGDRLAPSPGGRAAIIFFQAQSDHELQDLYERLLTGRLYSFA